MVRENERIDLIIEYFNRKLKNMAKDNSGGPVNLDVNNQQRVEAQSIENDPTDPLLSNDFTTNIIQPSEKEFVFNFRTFKEVFPYISSVSIADHSTLEKAYSECVKKHISESKKKASMLSNIIIIQFHKTLINNSSNSDGPNAKYKEWTNFFTYVHIPFLDKNVNTDIGTMSEIIGRAMEK